MPKLIQLNNSNPIRVMNMHMLLEHVPIEFCNIEFPTALRENTFEFFAGRSHQPAPMNEMSFIKLVLIIFVFFLFSLSNFIYLLFHLS